MQANALVGTWKLISFERISPSGKSYPLGADAVGFIMYQDNGYMSVAIMKRDRPHFSEDDLFSGTQAEKVAAYDGFICYAGRYTISGDTVIHHPEVSLYPNWVGRDQRRKMEVSGDTLTLTAEPRTVKGVVEYGRLVWKKVVGNMPDPG